MLRIRLSVSPWAETVIGKFARMAAMMAVFVAVDASRLSAAERPSPVADFLDSHCIDCHDGPDGEGGFDLSAMTDDLSDHATMQRWVRVFDRVVGREMPPPEDGKLADQEIDSFEKATKTFLVAEQQKSQAQFGRVRGRRLSKFQLERTLCDLLAVDLPLASLVPDEPRTSGFWGIADGQTMSHFHLQSHLKMVDGALDEAFGRLFEGEPVINDLPATRIANKRKGQRNREPEMLNGAAVAWNSTMPFYARISHSKVDESGWYDIELSASGLNIPQDHSGNWCSIRSGACNSGAPLMFWIDSFQVTSKPQTWKFRAYIQKDHLLEIRISDVRLKRARFEGGQVGFGEGTSQKAPGIAMHHLKLEQVFPAGDAAKVQNRLFGEMDVSLDRKKQRVEIKEPNLVKSLTRQLQSFATRAFRRPVRSKELKPYADYLQDELKSGLEPSEALRSAYRAILCSPRFLYFTEEPVWLDSPAYATRLSYLLTGTIPDWKLAKAARGDELKDPQSVIEHADRLLTGDHLDRFVSDFATQWLDLADIDFTEPDPKLHPDFDIIVQHAMVSETNRFLVDAFRRNVPVTDLVDARHTFVNGRLADFYGIDGVDFDRIKKVNVKSTPQRGGLLAQGAILKVTANGNDTSPIVRGVWVSERILGCEIPPPPENIPAVEPDTRGAKTIRDQLALHQADASCAACHKNIDPPGYALENFDAAGRWRDDYPKLKGRKIVKGLPIDPSFTMADGRDFDGFVEFKKLIANDPKPLARNLAAKLLTYGTGSEIHFADRDELDRIVAVASKDNYGVRSILNAVITSPVFRRK